MSRYRTRVREVEAVQWTGHNLDEIRSLCPDVSTRDFGWTLEIPTASGARLAGQRFIGGWLLAHVGYYVVRTADGTCVPMAPDHFDGAYERSDPPDTAEQPS